MDNICNSINTLSILKFIIKSTNPDTLDIKLIFIGPQIEKTQNILKKIEDKIENYVNKKKEIQRTQGTQGTQNIHEDQEYVHSILSSSENKYLETLIPHYITKFGNISNYNVFFIYKFIEENLPVAHVRIILYEIIKNYVLPKTKQNDNLYLPYNMLLYKYSKTMTFDYFIEKINYIFRKEHMQYTSNDSNDSNDYILNNETFFNIIYKMTYMNKKEIEDKLRYILPDKYDSIVPKFTTIETFKYTDCIKNDELQHLLLNIPIILTTQYNYTFENNNYNYYGYQNIDYLIDTYKTINKTKKQDKIKIINDKFNINTNDFLYVNLNYYNKTINNDYFIVLKHDLKDMIEDEDNNDNNNIVDFYFPKDLETKIKLNITQYKSIYDNFKLTTYKENIFNDKSINITECYYEDIIFETLSEKLNIKYNLAQIFNNLNTTFYNPVIKYFSNGIEKKHKTS